MADPPPIRRPQTRPPPIPRAPVAPLPAKTDVVPVPGQVEELSEITSSLIAPGAGALVAHMRELVATEAAALLTGDSDRLADLNVRSAIASWDALHQPDEALRLLELADGHPLASRLRVMAALDDPKQLM